MCLKRVTFRKKLVRNYDKDAYETRKVADRIIKKRMEAKQTEIIGRFLKSDDAAILRGLEKPLRQEYKELFNSEFNHANNRRVSALINLKSTLSVEEDIFFRRIMSYYKIWIQTDTPVTEDLSTYYNRLKNEENSTVPQNA